MLKQEFFFCISAKDNLKTRSFPAGHSQSRITEVPLLRQVQEKMLLQKRVSETEPTLTTENTNRCVFFFWNMRRYTSTIIQYIIVVLLVWIAEISRCLQCENTYRFTFYYWSVFSLVESALLMFLLQLIIFLAPKSIVYRLYVIISFLVCLITLQQFYVVERKME